MPSTRRRRRPLVVAAAVVVVLLAGCGAQNVEADARERALEGLETTVVDVLGCVAAAVPRIEPARGVETLSADLGDCAYTDVLNADTDAILSDQVVLPAGGGTVAFSGATTGDDLELRLVTQATGVAQAGVASARSSPATCWQLTADLATDIVQDYSGTQCHEAVMTRMNPTERVPFEDLDASDAPLPPG